MKNPYLSRTAIKFLRAIKELENAQKYYKEICQDLTVEEQNLILDNKDNPDFWNDPETIIASLLNDGRILGYQFYYNPKGLTTVVDLNLGFHYNRADQFTANSISELKSKLAEVKMGMAKK
jgi:hypothetical protein